MTLTLSIWFLPIAVTAIVWLVAIFYPSGPHHADDYGFGALFYVLLRLIIVAFVTPLIWLVFFAIMWWRA